MSIPVPNLDDRTFQDLVDEAKRRVADRCPEWTDHNVSDPGVTLIELFAQMADETIFRLNKVPGNLLLTFMNMLGMHLQPATAARTRLTFWLAAPTRYWEATADDAPLLAPAGVETATERQGGTEPVSFRTTADLRLLRAEVIGRYTVPAGSQGRAAPEPVHTSGPVPVFGPGRPEPGAALLVELVRPLPACALKVDLDCEPNRGTGIQPDDPPLVWEAWGRGTWQPCEVDRDTTGGLNRAGSVYLHVPPEHAGTALVGTEASSWLRCRVVAPRTGQPSYEQSPAVGRIAAQTLGVSVPAAQADLVVHDEVVGVSDGTYGQPPFVLRNAPVVADPGTPLLYAGDDPEPWRPVTSFESSGEGDRHYLVDRTGGRITLGVAVRQADGRVRRYGRVPPASAVLRLAEYRVGGGVRGNVRATAVRVLRSPVPHVRSVENRHPASGGVDPETVEQATVRVPLFLRQRTRAVTVADFTEMARDADPTVARSHAVPEGDPASSIGVHVVVVPELRERAGESSPIPQAELTDLPDMLTAVARYLDARRMVGIRVLVSPPRYVPVRVRTRLRVSPSADPYRVERAATEALYRLLHPLVGGEDGAGWPFGVDVQLGDVYAALQGVPGVARVEALTLYDDEGQETAGVPVPPHGLPLSLGHTVELS